MSVPAPAQAERRIPIPRLGRLTKDAHHPQHQSCTGGVAYLRLVWLDYISLLVVAGLTTGLYWSPMYYPGHQIISIRESSLRPLLSVAVHNPQGPDGLVYPAVEEPLPSWLCGVAVTVVPLMIIAAFQLKFRSLWDCHAGQLGLLKTAVVT
jgi:diacylglycerol diphosphate phosphatase/phosphatidate phosphatase